MAGSTPASASAEPRSRHRLAAASGTLLAAMMLVLALGPLVWTRPAGDVDFARRLEGPSAAHPLGTDDLGHDLLARMIHGGRLSLAVGLAAMLVSLVAGVAVGAAAGMAGGSVDAGLMWLADLFLSLPQLPMLLLLIYLFHDSLKEALGPEGGIFVLIVAVIGGFRWMPVARLVRAQFLSLREAAFVEAARAVGASALREVIWHILPNALGPVIVAATVGVADAIIAEATFSFLGLGFPPDVPTWGRLLYDAKDYLDAAPHWARAPAAAIALTVIAVNFLGDGLRDRLDPRGRGGR